MPDLGKYAGVVLSSYAIALVLLVGLVALTLWRGARVRRHLAEAEARALEARRDAARQPAPKTAPSVTSEATP